MVGGNNSIRLIREWVAGGYVTGYDVDRAAIGMLLDRLKSGDLGGVFTPILTRYFSGKPSLGLAEAELFIAVWDLLDGISPSVATIQAEEPRAIYVARLESRRDHRLEPDQDFALAEALISDPRFRAKLFEDRHADLVTSFIELLEGNSYAGDVNEVLRAYDLANGRKDPLKVKELEEARRQSDELTERIARLEHELDQ